MNEAKINKQGTKDIKQHISSKELQEFHQNKLTKYDLKRFLEHTSSCDFCADLLAESMEGELVLAPPDMKMNILNKSKHLGVQVSKLRRDSKQKQLFQYSFKVVVASLSALILVFSLNKLPDNPSMNKVIPIELLVITPDQASFISSMRSGMDKVSNQILDFSNNIINTEVIKND